MYRLNNLDYKNAFKKFVDKSNSIFTESLTDETYYISTSEEVKRLNNLSKSSSLNGVYYDYQDGVDTHKRDNLVRARQRGLDIAEVNYIVNEDVENFNFDLSKVAEKKRKLAEDLNNINNKSDSVNNNINNVSSGDVSNSSN